MTNKIIKVALVLNDELSKIWLLGYNSYLFKREQSGKLTERQLKD